MSFHYSRLMNSKIPYITELLGELTLEEYCHEILIKNKELIDLSSAFTLLVLRFFEESGKQTFELGSNLRKVLERLNVRDFSASRLCRPYDSFYINLLDVHHEDWVIHGGGRTGWHQVEGMYVNFWKTLPKQFRLEQDNRDILATVTLTAPPNPGVKKSIAGKILSLASEGGYDNDLDDATYRFNIIDNGNLEKTVEMAFSNFKGLDPSQQRPSAVLIEKAIRVVLNLCLYLSSKNADLRRIAHPSALRISQLERELKNLKPSKSHYAKKMKRLKKEKAKATITRVGFQLEQEIEERDRRDKVTDKEWEEKLRQNPGQRKQMKHQWVRGHEKWVWCGSGENKHPEIRIIESYERGVDLEQTKEREKYIVI